MAVEKEALRFAMVCLTLSSVKKPLPPASGAPVKTRPPRSAAPLIRRQVTTTLAALARKTGALDPEVIEHWGEIVGPELEKLCRPVKIKRYKNAETLHVSVPHDAAKMRVQYAQTQILARAAQYLGRRNLTRIAFDVTGQAKEKKQPRWKSRNISRPLIEAENAQQKAVALPPARSLDEALNRLRRSVSQGRKP